MRAFRIPAAPNDVPQLNLYFTATPTLTWGRVSWATRYRIEVDTEPGFTGVQTLAQTLPSTQQQVTLPPLTANTTYYWRVCALAAGQTVCTRWSPTQTFTVVQS